MMNAKMFVPKFLTRQNIIIGLSTIIIWLMAAYGWRQAFNDATNNYYCHREISLSSLFSTLLVLPLPYGAFRFYKYLAQKYPTVDWNARLAAIGISVLILVLIAYGLFLGFIFFVALAGGGLDIMFPCKTDIILDTVYDSLPVGIGVALLTLITILITFDRGKNIHLLLLLPAFIINGILFFKLMFLAGMKM